MIAFQTNNEQTAMSIVVTAFAVLLSFLWYIGVFKKIRFHEETIGPFKFIYRTNKGPYHEVGPMFNSTIKYMYEIGVGHLRTSGIYYDNPELVQNPRYAIGFIIEKKEDEEKFNKIKGSIVKEWKVLELKETKTVASYFPMRFTIISCALSAMKTYRAFKSQTQYSCKVDESIGSLEIYYKDKIGTYFPQSNFIQFKAETD